MRPATPVLAALIALLPAGPPALAAPAGGQPLFLAEKSDIQKGVEGLERQGKERSGNEKQNQDLKDLEKQERRDYGPASGDESKPASGDTTPASGDGSKAK